MIDASQWLAEVVERWQCGQVAETPEAAVSRLAERHGSAGVKFGQLALNPDADRSDLFAAKNQSLSLSLDAAMLWSGELYKQQLPLVVEAVVRLRPKRIIDVGCEQGLISCLVAAAAPDASAVGIDRCPQAIARASELATALDLHNVRFVCADPLAENPDQGSFDLLIESRAMLGEALPGCDAPPELLPGELPAHAAWRDSAEAAAAALGELLGPNGHAVMFERTDTSGVVRWARALASAGFTFTGPHRTLIAEEPGGQAYFRFLEAQRGSSNIAPRPQDLIANFPLPDPGAELHGEEAEAAALHLNTPHPPTAWEWTNSNQDRERIELVNSAEGNLVELRCSTNGERTLCIHSGTSEAAVRERTERFVEASAGANLSWVDSILPCARGKIEF